MDSVKIVKSKQFQVVLFVALPLVIGGLAYYLFCPSVVFVKLIDSAINLNVHIPYEAEENIVLSLLRWYLLDFLWAFSFASAVYLIFENKRLSMVISLMIPIVFGVVFEILQYVGVVAGTFDICDIVAEALAIGMSVFSNMKYGTRRYAYEKI